ncbi:MAG: phosphoribosylanthranilate isomerase, partial [Aquificaceae bacterium]
SLRVDYLGIILYSKSPRYVEMGRVVKLLEAVKGPKSVAVMVNPTLEEAREALEMGFDLIQLHGEESIDFAMKIGIERVIKAFRSCPGLKVQEEWKEAHAVLLDACSASYGGSGKRSDWSIAKELVERGFRVILAGGLNSESVREAIKTVKPFGVDVSSGIEISPGIKDHKKMEEFVHAVKNALGN